MVLNIIWLVFFFGAFVACMVQWLAFGDSGIFNKAILGAFDMSKTAFEIAIGLTGILSLWLGIMKIGEKAGAVQILAKIVSPLFSRLFPEIPKNHPVIGTMLMNISANMLGLDNAATPMGLQAMKQLQDERQRHRTAMLVRSPRIIGTSIGQHTANGASSTRHIPDRACNLVHVGSWPLTVSS